MYLKAIEIFGFKSFGEKVFIEFNKGITSIVGPNGSGKSNILDAVLWVLGEQSYKNIRAKESTDVIFSGGKDKKPMNFAEVSLYIDNSDSFLALEEDQIKITRKILNSGENEYYINDSKTRLKDIGNLFLDTGVGKNAYSVIGQGKVERIIGSSAKEIKNIIEEAAGIKKFQSQKNESIKNLENVDLELEKIQLILSEVEENKNKIEKQAGKAQEYLGLKKERDILAKAIYEKDYEKLKSEVSQNIENKNVIEKELLKYKSDFNEINDRINAIDYEKKELRKYIDEIGNKNIELKNTIDDKEREKVKIGERISGYKREFQDKNQRFANNNVILEEKTNHLTNLENELKVLQTDVISLENENSIFEKEIAKLDKEKSDFELQREIKKSKIRDLELERLKLINDIENSNRRVNGSSSKIKLLENEKTDYDENLKTLLKEENLLKENHKERVNTLDKLIERESFLEQEISNNSTKLNKVAADIRNFEYNEKRVGSKLESLIRLEENNEGFFKGVKEVLNSNIPGVEGVFISLVEVPEMYEKAIGAGIPGNIQDIVVTSSEVAKKGIQVLKEKHAGRASFLALDTIKVMPKKTISKDIDGVIGIASELVKTKEKYQLVVDFLLNNLLVVDKIDTGLKILKNNLFSGNVVTLSGELLSARGRITGGDSGNSPASMIFERKKEIRNLKEEHNKLKENIRKASIEQEHLNNLLKNFEDEISKIEPLQNDAKRQVKSLEEKLSDLTNKISRVNKDVKTVEIELENEIKYAQEFEKKINTSNSEKEKIEFLITNLKSEEEMDIRKNKELSDNIEKRKNEFSDKKILLLNSRDKITQCHKNIKREKDELNKAIEEKNNFIESIEQLKNTILELEKNYENLEKELNVIIQQYESKNSDVLNKIKINDALTEEERNLLKKKQELDSYILHKDDSLKKISESVEKNNQQINNLLEQLESLKEISIEGVEILNIAKSKDELKKFDNQLKNFQNVNLCAIEEFKELEERFNFLNSQKEDLVKGKNVLIELIKEIDQTIKNRFFNAYKEIDKNFEKMCIETLNNSTGSLNLTNPENFDECGVEIFVKFKNKKRQSLSLLSGGEKSMVAIAFIMAIFMYKPSPFTFLDEIEAALDEKNTRKLIGKLKEFNDKSQFILITHNKDTMRESDSIFGVTMNKEIGISKIVPVTF